jgi:hypothetical protein
VDPITGLKIVMYTGFFIGMIVSISAKNRVALFAEFVTVFAALTLTLIHIVEGNAFLISIWGINTGLQTYILGKMIDMYKNG